MVDSVPAPPESLPSGLLCAAARQRLGGGFYATRLYRDLRHKNGYVYNVDNSLHAGETRATTYSVTYVCHPIIVSKPRALVDEDLQADFVCGRKPGPTAVACKLRLKPPLR